MSFTGVQISPKVFSFISFIWATAHHQTTMFCEKNQKNNGIAIGYCFYRPPESMLLLLFGLPAIACGHECLCFSLTIKGRDVVTHGKRLFGLLAVVALFTKILQNCTSCTRAWCRDSSNTRTLHASTTCRVRACMLKVPILAVYIYLAELKTLQLMSCMLQQLLSIQLEGAYSRCIFLARSWR